MSIAADLIKLEHSAKIQLFVIDATVVGGSIHHFHNGTNGFKASVIWQGVEYTPFPIEAEGFEQAVDGPLPRPKVRVSNVLGLIGVLNRQYDNLRGATFIRKRTLARYLDAVNFPGGVNPDADPTAGHPDDIWTVDRLASQNDLVCEYELASPIDVAGVMIPGRQVIARLCGREYRGPECGYAGPPVADWHDQPTTDPALDRCGGRLSSCRLRFGTDPDGIPFGGFPGCGQLRRV